MSRSLMSRMVRALALDLPSASDRELLARFLASRDPEAFAALVRRHGPMVRSVCRRILRHDHDAEDGTLAAKKATDAVQAINRVPAAPAASSAQSLSASPPPVSSSFDINDPAPARAP